MGGEVNKKKKEKGKEDKIPKFVLKICCVAGFTHIVKTNSKICLGEDFLTLSQWGLAAAHEE